LRFVQEITKLLADDMTSSVIGEESMITKNSVVSRSFVLRACLGLAAVVAGLCAGPSELRATPIVYTLEGVGSGSLGGSPFNNTYFIITSTANTDQITSGGGLFTVPTTSAIIDVTGVSTAAFTGFTSNFLARNSGGFPTAGIDQDLGTPNSLTVLDIFMHPGLEFYQMNTDIGPLNGSATFNAGLPFPTTGGNLVFDTINEVTFRAYLGVPEPNSAVLLASGALACVVAARRQRAA
jgi:hypothetical protein